MVGNYSQEDLERYICLQGTESSTTTASQILRLDAS